MLRRISLFVVVGVLAVFVLAACGEDDEGVEPTVTRIPASNVPVVAPTTAPTTAAASPAAASPAAAGSPAASPVAGGATTPEATAEASAAASPAANGTAPAANGVTVNLLDIKFDPKEITIPANTEVVITVINKGAAQHTFDVDALNIHTGGVAPGATTTVTVNAAPGDYEYYCAEPGHKQAGMVGTLHVVAEGSPPAATPAASPASSPSVPAVAVGPAPTVDLLDIRFEPKELTIPANTDVTINLVNKGVTVHTFDVDALNIQSGDVAPGETKTVTINAAPGEYQYYCAIPGHKQAGMVGKLIVQ